MTDTLLSIILPLNIWIDNLLTMGLPVIQESMDKILNVMRNSPLKPTELVGLAKGIGACCALGVGSYEAWMMMLGRRAMDIMKIIRIIIISACISGSSWITKAAAEPGYMMEDVMRTHTKAINSIVAEKEQEVAKKQKEYLDSLRSAAAKQYQEKEAAIDKQDDGGLLDIKGKLNQLGSWITTQLKEGAVIAETKLAEFANDIIRFIGELLFQMMFYGMLLGQRCFLAILGMFCPIAFAMSLAPPYKSAWSQWLSKYLSISLWGFVVYCILYYVEYFIVYFLNQDVTSYNNLMNSSDMGSWGNIGALGIQSIGTTCQYAIAMLIGFKILGMVPEVASWLIPGGVSSGMGSASAGMAAAAGGAIGAAAGTAVSAAAGAPSAAISLGGAIQQARSDGHGSGIGYGILASTGWGKAAASGADNARNLNNVGKSDSNYTQGGKTESPSSSS